MKKISQNGVDLIKSFEGCRLEAYKPVVTEKYYTIGYGHYGLEITKEMRITQQTAEEMLVKDLFKYESYVNNPAYCPVTDKLNQNQFDALVSFTFNCGAGNLKGLCLSRTIEKIGEDMLLYNKAGGVVLQGLVRRRKAELDLYQKKELIKLDNNVVDYIIDVMNDYWKRMNGNPAIQNYTNFATNQLRKAVGRKEE